MKEAIRRSVSDSFHKNKVLLSFFAACLTEKEPI